MNLLLTSWLLRIIGGSLLGLATGAPPPVLSFYVHIFGSSVAVHEIAL